MNQEFTDLIQNNKVIYNLSNCPCCLGTLSRGIVLKKFFPGIILTLSCGMDIQKRKYFPYPIILDNFEEVIKNNSITLIIHDFNINYELFNAGIKLKIPQYFLCVNLENQWISNSFDKIILPYPVEMSPEFVNIKKEKIFSGLICKEIDNSKVGPVKDKYKISDKPVMVISLSTGTWPNTEKVFQYCYDNFKGKFDLVFIYGLFYKGKTFLDIKSSVFEEDLIELFSVADTAVTFGSYNTMAELISLKKNIIAIPRQGNPSQQEVKRFQKYYQNIQILNIKE